MKEYLIMKPINHIAVSTLISVILYAIFKSWALTVSSFISGVFIDLDHVIDYWREYGISFDVKKFLYVHDTKQYRKTHMILHGWEWLILLGIVALLTDWNPWVTGVLIGVGQHIALDNINYRESFWSYSLAWRWSKGFKTEVIFRKKRLGKSKPFIS